MRAEHLGVQLHGDPAAAGEAQLGQFGDPLQQRREAARVAVRGVRGGVGVRGRVGARGRAGLVRIGLVRIGRPAPQVAQLGAGAPQLLGLLGELDAQLEGVLLLGAQLLAQLADLPAPRALLVAGLLQQPVQQRVLLAQPLQLGPARDGGRLRAAVQRGDGGQLGGQRGTGGQPPGQPGQQAADPLQVLAESGARHCGVPEPVGRLVRLDAGQVAAGSAAGHLVVGERLVDGGPGLGGQQVADRQARQVAGQRLGRRGRGGEQHDRQPPLRVAQFGQQPVEVRRPERARPRGDRHPAVAGRQPRQQRANQRRRLGPAGTGTGRGGQLLGRQAHPGRGRPWPGPDQQRGLPQPLGTALPQAPTGVRAGAVGLGIGVQPGPRREADPPGPVRRGAGVVAGLAQPAAQPLVGDGAAAEVVESAGDDHPVGTGVHASRVCQDTDRPTSNPPGSTGT